MSFARPPILCHAPWTPRILEIVFTAAIFYGFFGAGNPFAGGIIVAAGASVVTFIARYFPSLTIAINSEGRALVLESWHGILRVRKSIPCHLIVDVRAKSEVDHDNSCYNTLNLIMADGTERFLDLGHLSDDAAMSGAAILNSAIRAVPGKS